MENKLYTGSEEETEKTALDFSKKLKGSEIIALTGDLGTGKTCFVRGMCLGLGIDNVVHSPTFTLLNIYNGKYPVYHFDLYRLKSMREVIEIGFDEYIGKKDGICVIEWAEKIEESIPANAVWIKIKHCGENKRELLIKI